ncbi:MAG: hypothetical protein M3326_02735 [Actinomycetota bacterium]|nr:hypothetical protein [Actinomycetota bacterium]
MVGAIAIVIALVALLLLFNAIWPPAWAPEEWRRRTRPLRRRLRPRHYR